MTANETGLATVILPFCKGVRSRNVMQPWPDQPTLPQQPRKQRKMVFSRLQTRSPMPRQILDESQIHPAIQKIVVDHHKDIVQEVQNAIAKHKVVVVGMTQNPVVKSARINLSQAGIAHHYLEYGSYFSQWRRRNALKMWTGWPTFPMVFFNGKLVGGGKEVKALLASSELQ